MFKHVSKVLVLALLIAVFLPSYVVMGMENEVEQTKVFVPKEMATEEEFLEEILLLRKKTKVFVPKEMASEDELLEEDFIEDQQSDIKPYVILFMLTKQTELKIFNWFETVIPCVIGYVTVTPPVKITNFGLSVTEPQICEYFFD